MLVYVVPLRNDVKVPYDPDEYAAFKAEVAALADRPLVDAGYAMPLATMSALDVWTLAFLFGFQIYFDFSAYSHIALGSARMMGIVFPENFNFPYLASSPKDFWRRRHISLSSWFRDYLYLPLAGIKVHDRSVGGLATATTDRRHNKSLFLTWGIMGLWHGANWTFLLWGLYHAAVVTPIPADRARYPRAGVAGAMVGVFATYGVQEKLLPRLARRPVLAWAGDSLSVAVMTALVIVFLRPINQFIYFQF